MNSNYAFEVLDGALLSDAKLVKHPSGEAYFGIALSGAEHMDWLLFLKTTLSDVGISTSPMYPKVTQASNRGKPYDYCYFNTLSNPLLTEQHKRWYINGVKQVPIDIKLTPTVCANWFMGDGSTSRYKARGNSNLVILRLNTNSFSTSDIIILEELLEDIGISTFRAKAKSGVVIQTENATTINKFLDVVESSMIPSYMYKVKRPWLKVIKEPGRHLKGPFLWLSGEWVKL